MRTIVLVINRARLDAMGLYGSETAMTPHLDRLASESVVFDQHYAELPHIRGARRAWNMGCCTNPGGLRAPMGLAERLWEDHVRTVLIGGERCPTRGTAFAQGWETTHWLRKEQLAAMNQPTLVDGTLQLAIDWLELHGAAQEKWCLWLEVDSLIPPWDPSEFSHWEPTKESPQSSTDATARVDENETDREDTSEQASEKPQPTSNNFDDADQIDDIEPSFNCHSGIIRRQDNESIARNLQAWLRAYNGIMTYVDDLVGQFVHLLKELELYDKTTFIITSDIGWPMGEHGIVGDAIPQLHEELVHLPLLIHLPGSAEAGRRVHHLTQPVDLPVTLADLHRLPWATSSTHGNSLVPLLHGQLVQKRDYICSQSRRGQFKEWMIRTHQWCFILPFQSEETGRERQLFIKPDDRFEVNNVVSQYPQVADHLELTLRRYFATFWCDPLASLPPLQDDLLKIAQ